MKGPRSYWNLDLARMQQAESLAHAEQRRLVRQATTGSLGPLARALHTVGAALIGTGQGLQGRSGAAAATPVAPSADLLPAGTLALAR